MTDTQWNAESLSRIWVVGDYPKAIQDWVADQVGRAMKGASDETFLSPTGLELGNEVAVYSGLFEEYVEGTHKSISEILNEMVEENADIVRGSRPPQIVNDKFRQTCEAIFQDIEATISEIRSRYA